MVMQNPSTQPPSDRLAVLYHLTQAFNSTLDLDQVLNRVLDEVILSTQAERGFLTLLDDTGELVFRVARGIEQSTIQDPKFQISLSVVEKVAKDGNPVITGDAQIDPRFSARQSVQLLGLRSILCVPLTIKDKILGTIYVDNRVQVGIFTPGDLEMLSAIASSAAIAIENARLYQVAVDKGRLERELQMAHQVQASLLPLETPQVPGWDFDGTWLPARQVAGDYYDFIPFQDGKLGVIIADVSDKGMPAALFMALTRSTLRASMDGAQSPLEGITRANRLICEDSTSGMFVTLFYALLDPERHEITYVNAGHNPPLFYHRSSRASKGQLGHLGRTGMALGVLNENIYSQQTLKFSPGDFMILYTDGVTEAIDEDGVEFGIHNLEKIVLNNEDATAGEIVTAVQLAVENHSQEGARFDDTTIAVIKRI